MGRKKLPRTDYLNDRFSVALSEFASELKKSGAIKHRGNKGSAREDVLRSFFKERLPTKYSVVEGEVVDLNGNISPQLDVMFFDQSINFAFNSDNTKILPAESLLASIEVKSRLTKDEIKKSVIAARALRSLKPYGYALGGSKVDEQASAKVARYYHCIFAYDTDLSESEWLKNEHGRVSSLCGGDHLFDNVFVLNRGILNLSGKKGRLEDEDGGAVTSFYFSILNFIQREAKRRSETPFERYVRPLPKQWVDL